MKYFAGIQFIALGIGCLYWRFKYPQREAGLALNFKLVIIGFGFIAMGVMFIKGDFDK